MMWQDIIFLVGSCLSIIFLYPTLKDTASQVPRTTSVPSMTLGIVYASTFTSMNMDFSAAGSLITGLMWAMIMVFRPTKSPEYSEELAEVSP